MQHVLEPRVDVLLGAVHVEGLQRRVGADEARLRGRLDGHLLVGLGWVGG
jgi:hypothetical protein